MQGPALSEPVYLRTVAQLCGRVSERVEDGVLRVGAYSCSLAAVLGRGLNNTVYLGTHEGTREKAAVKQVDLLRVTNEVEQTLLGNELQSLRAVQHPNVVRLLACYHTDRFVYIVTRFYEDGELSWMIRRQGAMPILYALKIFEKVVEGYLHLAELGILHRDLKTSNIMLSQGQPVIIDLGFSDHPRYPRPTLYYNVGSPAYMAPEAYSGGVYSSKSDVWSLGIILH